MKLVYAVYSTSIPKQALKSSPAVSLVSVELKTNVSEMSSVSIIRVYVVNDHLLLIFIRRYQFIKSMPLPIDVLCGRREVSNCGVTHPTLTYHHVA
jgi:hypothetical protein